MNITIPRARWQRGLGCELGNFLQDGKYCVIGFILAACGFTDEELDNRGSIADLQGFDVATRVPAVLAHVQPSLDDDTILYAYASDVTRAVTDANDDTNLTDAEREERIIHALAPHAIHVTFTDAAA